jgi:hypothetical protein
VKRLGIPDLEVCARFELPLEKRYPGRQFHRYRSFEEHIPDNVKELLFGTSARIMASMLKPFMLKDIPEKQLFRYYR